MDQQHLKMFRYQGIFKLQEVMGKMFRKVIDYIGTKVKNIKQGGPITCLCVTIVLMVPLIGLAILLRVRMKSPELYIIYVDTEDEALYTTNAKFLSLGLDSTVITDGFRNFNMSDIRLAKMIGYLSPAFLRVGGNQADQILFQKDHLPDVDGLSNNETDRFYLTASDWTSLYKLSQLAGVTIIYDLNSLHRHDNGTWNSANAEEMLQFSSEHQFVVNWELGNEPNSYLKKFGTYVNATQLGKDYETLREILNKYPLYNDSLLVGPSTTRLRNSEIENYLLEFLEAGGNAISALTFHQYYFSGENATYNEFLDPSNFDYLEYCIDAVKSVVSLIDNFNTRIWLGETSTAWHSGAPNMSDRFLASFLWIDKLGLSAKMGIDVVVRQSIFKGFYALINDTYYPNPDWWVSILYKQLVGREVITTEVEGDQNIRLYAHCAKANNLWGDGSAVVVFGVNLKDDIGYVQVKELRSDSNVYSYSLRSDGTLFSQFVLLNGKFLELDKNLELPDLEPVIIERTDTMQIDPLSIIFWVFTNTNLNACSS